MVHCSIQELRIFARWEIQEDEMPSPVFLKAGFVLCLLSVFAASAEARGWYDFTPREPSLKQSGHWEWEWDGSDGLGIGLTGATVRYVPTLPARIVITGPNEALEQVRVGQGQIRWCEDCRGAKGLEITVSGVPLHSVALNGANIDIQLGRLDQDRLNLALAGTGQISAAVRIARLELYLSGAGNVRMEEAAV